MTRILIIDDNQPVRAFLTELLTAEGYDILDAPNADAGILIHKESPVDLIITDMCMPQKSGIDIIEELAPKCPDLKFIAISGGPGSEATTGFSVYEQMLKKPSKLERQPY